MGYSKWLTAVVLIAGILSSCATSGFYHLKTLQFDEIDYGYQVKTLKVRNINVAYIDEGQGDRVLLLIHGLGSSAKGWIKNIAPLAEDYRVLAVDLPGYGRSDKGYYDYSMSFYVTLLKEFLNGLNIKQAVFIGHSMGGQIAISAALQEPQLVSALVLISPAGFERFTDGEGDWMKNAVTEEFVHDTPIRNIDVNARANFYDMPDWAEFIITDRIAMRGADGFSDYCYAVSRNVAAMIDGPVWDKLNKISQKTLILFGENDGLIPNPYLHGGFTRDIAQIGVKAIPDNRLQMVPECGHFVQLEKPEVVNEAIKSFLK